MSAWIPVVILLVAAGFYVVAKLVGGGDKPKRELMTEARTEVDDIKASADVRLAAELEAVEADKAELESIKEIDDEGERLAALAAYGNRRRGSP